MGEYSDNKLDEDLFYLQRQIHVIQAERKQIEKETKILKQRVVMLANQLNDIDTKCNSQSQIINKRLENNSMMRAEEKRILDLKCKKQIELENKRNIIIKQLEDNKANKNKKRNNRQEIKNKDKEIDKKHYNSFFLQMI